VRRYFSAEAPDLLSNVLHKRRRSTGLIPRMMPGNPIASLVTRSCTGCSPEFAQAMVTHYQNLFGLDKSLPEQFNRFLGVSSPG